MEENSNGKGQLAKLLESLKEKKKTLDFAIDAKLRAEVDYYEVRNAYMDLDKALALKDGRLQIIVLKSAPKVALTPTEMIIAMNVEEKAQLLKMLEGEL